MYADNTKLNNDWPSIASSPLSILSGCEKSQLSPFLSAFLPSFYYSFIQQTSCTGTMLTCPGDTGE